MKILNLLDGGCQLPLGAYCSQEGRLFVSFAKSIDSKVHRLNYTINGDYNFAEKVIADLRSSVN